MARTSPLLKLHQQAEAALLPYAPADSAPDQVVEVVGTYGELELEYAAIRKGCVLVDQPHRGVIEVAGPERLAFLNRMITQELKGLAPLDVRRSFWLNRKGRIDADLRLVELGERLLMDLDVHAAARTVGGLNTFIISEDVTLRDASDTLHRLALHGPTAAGLLSAALQPRGPAAFSDLLQDRAMIAGFDGHDVVVFRDDLTGEPGFELVLPVEITVALFQRLIELGAAHDHDAPPNPQPHAAFRLRPAGWHAVNIARIEAGRPLYNVDFGPDSLPAESGVIHDRVSFTKGCYLGQEIVARMHARGHPKRLLVALKFAAAENHDPAVPLAQPDTGSLIFAATAEAGDAIGAVTSCTPSPMLGSRLIAFAQAKFEHAKAGVEVKVEAQGALLHARIQPGLAFWRKG